MPSGFLERLRPAFGLRLAAWYAGLFVARAGALFALTYHLLARSLERGDHELVVSTLTEYASQYQAGGLDALRRALEARQQAGADADLFVRVLGSGRDTLLLSLPNGWAELASAPSDPPALAGILEWSARPGKSEGAMLEVASLRFADGTLFEVGKSSERRAEVLERFRAVLAGMLALALLAGLTGGALFTHSALRPLRHLTRVVGGIIDTGRLSERVAVGEGRDPLDALARLVNSMLGRIESLVAAMRDSRDNVAHDLRTPLTGSASIERTGAAPSAVWASASASCGRSSAPMAGPPRWRASRAAAPAFPCVFPSRRPPEPRLAGLSGLSPS